MLLITEQPLLVPWFQVNESSNLNLNLHLNLHFNFNLKFNLNLHLKSSF